MPTATPTIVSSSGTLSSSIDWNLVVTIAALVVALIVLLFGDALLIRFRNWYSRKETRPMDSENSQTPSTSELIGSAESLLTEALDIIPHILFMSGG